MVEKSEYRASGAQAVGKLMAKMPCQDYAAIVKWLYNYSQNNKVNSVTITAPYLCIDYLIFVNALVCS